jgi:hypothetical protein
MIDFVAYFSTAQAELGYIILEEHGSISADMSGGPMLPSGTYRVEGGGLVPVLAEAGDNEEGG